MRAARTSAYAVNANTEARERRPADLGADTLHPTRDDVPPECDQRDGCENELEVRDHRRVLDSLLVDEGVARDRGSDRQREDHSSGIRLPTQPANEEDPATDQHDPKRLQPADGHTHDGRSGEHEHRCAPARDRVDEAEVRAAVRGRQQREVRDLEERRHRDPRKRGDPDLPGRRRERREQHDGEAERDRRRGSDVGSAGEQNVPDRHGARPRQAPARTPRAARYASRMIVTGPSFVSATSMRAPKTPVDTLAPNSWSAPAKWS